MYRTAAATYIVTVITKTVTAAATDHQIRAAMTGSPTSSQAPTARVSIPLALRSANHSASRITRRHVLRLSCSVRTARATSLG